MSPGMSLASVCVWVLCTGDEIMRGMGGIEVEEVGGNRGVELADLVPRKLDFFGLTGPTVGVNRLVLDCRFLDGRPVAVTTAGAILGWCSSLPGDDVRRFL